MAVQSLSTIKNWFKTRLKPTQTQFWDTWDSFWHKNDTIPVDSVENLSSILNGKASQEGVNNALESINDDISNLGSNKVDKIEGKELSDENFTTEQKMKLSELQNIIITSPDHSVLVKQSPTGCDLSVAPGFEYDIHATTQMDDDLMTIKEVKAAPAAGSYISIACGSDGRFVIVATQGGRLFYSENRGKTWSETQPAGDTDKTWGSVACSYNAQVVIASCNAGGRLWKSTDRCATWVELRPAGDFDYSWGNCLAISNLGTHIIAGALYSRLYKSDDAGATWTEIRPKGDTGQTWFVAAVSEDGQTIIAGTNAPGDVYISKDGGVTFTHLAWPEILGDVFVSADGQKICMPKDTEDPHGCCLLTSFEGGGNLMSYEEAYYLPESITGGFGALWMSRNGTKIAVSGGNFIATSTFHVDGDWTFHKLRNDGIGIITASDDGAIYYAVGWDGNLYRIEMRRINDPFNQIEVDVTKDVNIPDPWFSINYSDGFFIEDSDGIGPYGNVVDVISLDSSYDNYTANVYITSRASRVVIGTNGFIINNLDSMLSKLDAVKMIRLNPGFDINMLASIIDGIRPHRSPNGYISVGFDVSEEIKSIAAEKGWIISSNVNS